MFIDYKTTFPNYGTYSTSFSTISRKSPTVNLTVKKSRLKNYNNNFYLENNSNFELEFFNPDTVTYGVKIEINNILISDNFLVLKPGERIFLERYLDENKSFIFNSYKVEDSAEAKQAIIDNGNLKIYFYQEKQIQQQYYINLYNSTTNINSTAHYFPNTVTNTVSNQNNISKKFRSAVNKLSFNSNDDSIGINLDQLNDIETGRIEKGKNTDQHFKTIDMNFESTYNNFISYKLLPISLKPIEKKDIINNICKCGNKFKKNHKFCSNCGNKI